MTTPVFDPVAQDPSIDEAHPPRMDYLNIFSQGARLDGVMYVASGAGPHPVVMILTGVPGNERNGDLAHAYARAGISSFVFNYRGAWGSEGNYSFANAIEDAHCALDFLLDEERMRKYRVDPRRIFVMGYSAGGCVALLLAARRAAEIVACITIGAMNVGGWGVAFETEESTRALEADLGAEVAMLRGASGVKLAAEIRAHLDDWNVLHHASALARKPVMLVTEEAEYCPPHVIGSLTGAIRAAGGQVHEIVYPCNHSFMTHRIALVHDTLAFMRQHLA